MAAPAAAQVPTISAIDNGNGTATVSITPDGGFLPAALAVEVAIQTTGVTLTSVTEISTEFDTDNPGDNPFSPGSPIGGDATGLVLDLPAGQIFGAFGSDVVSAATPIDLLTIAFTGTGDLTLAPVVVGESGGNVLAQAGVSLNFATDTISLGGGGGPVPGDTDGDGDVDLGDLDTLATNFGGTPPLVGGASIGDFDGDGDVDLGDLDALATNFGFGTSTAVPEPTAAVLAALAACGFAARRR